MGFTPARIAVSIRVLAAATAVVVLSLPAVASAAGDAERGRKIAYTCHGCHGIADYKNAYPNYSVPKLYGQSSKYLASALAEYRNKARPHPTMQGQADTLDDQEIADIAAYFSGERVVSDGEPTGTAPESAAVCVSCHGTDGAGITDDYPTLSGQHADYLEQALNDYRLGKRKNAIMAPFAQQLQKSDIKALAQYFSQQTPALSIQTKR
jgi:cytochrome c553